MNAQIVEFKREGPLAHLILNRPEQLNGIDIELQSALLQRLEQVSQDGEIRALIISARGRAFSAGGDLELLLSERPDGRSAAQAAAAMMRELSNPLITALEQLPVATVCAVQGVAAGAGASLALSCDVVIAADGAFFLLPFLPKLGLVPDLGMSWYLARGISRARALGLMLLGPRLSAQQAEQWGLIWATAPADQLLSQAMEVGHALAAAPASAALEARRALYHAYQSDLTDQMNYETDRQQELLASADFREGARAFLERRPAQFSPRSVRGRSTPDQRA